MSHARHAMNHVEVRHSPPATLDSPYSHHYGGVARDVFLTRVQFARFWGVSVEYVDSLPVNQKVFDDMSAGGEVLGYILRRRWLSDKDLYWVCIIRYKDLGHGIIVEGTAAVDIAPPHGIERP